VSDLESPRFSTGWAVMAMYMRCLFNLQHNTGRTVIELRMDMNANKEKVTATSCETERLRHENAILRRGTLQSLDKDLELQVVYLRNQVVISLG
jgi:anti-sigma-K factor RskA